MRENRLYGSEGGVARAIPTPIRRCARRRMGRHVGTKVWTRAIAPGPWLLPR